MSLSSELEARGFIQQFSAATLAEILDGEKRVVYHGIDPSADSAHVGNMAAWLLLRHLHQHGHTIIFLVGGGTGMIGDPKPDVERPLLSEEEVQERVAKLRAQAEHLLGATDIIFVNNHDWLTPLRLIDFLRDIGKHFTINELVKKDAIATRLGSENGISYTEFAYPLLQAYDYYELHTRFQCDLQIGGSDQWGNMVAGVDLIRRKLQKSVYALTIPLIIDKATGKKFGKSEGNAVWLDKEKTSPYTFYQFWLNVSDESVIDYLKIFTFLALEDIGAIEKAFEANPGVRLAKKRLAHEVTRLVHGEHAADTAAAVSDILFGDTPLTDVSTEHVEILLANAPTSGVSVGDALVDVLVTASLATSKREARTFIESGAITLNGEKIADTDFTLKAENFVNNIALVRRGKKNLSVLRKSD
ncbi:MAG: tyrosine--tRNA ligase [Patescibacteria group bacterium]